MLTFHTILLLICIPLLACGETATIFNADKWAVFPEYKSLKLTVNANDLRVYFAPWHDVPSSAEAFARTVLRAAEGKNMAGLGCDDNGTACLGLVALRIEAALNASLICSQIYNQIDGSRKPHFSLSMHDPHEFMALIEECTFHAAGLEDTIEYEAGALEEAAFVDFYYSSSKGLRVKRNTVNVMLESPSTSSKAVVADELVDVNEDSRSSSDRSYGSSKNSSSDVNELVSALARVGVSAKHASRLAEEEITVAELPLLREDHLLSLGIPLGPALRILHAFAASVLTSSTGPHKDSRGAKNSTREEAIEEKEEPYLEVGPIEGPLWPYGQEGTEWARTPCTPPYCWHACEPKETLPMQAGSVDGTNDADAGAGTGANDEEHSAASLTAEEASEWKPESRHCTVVMDFFYHRGGAYVDDDIAAGLEDGTLATTRPPFPELNASAKVVQQVWLHPIAIGVPASMVVGCVPRKSRHVAPEKPAAKGAMRGMRYNYNTDKNGSSKKGPYADYAFGPREEHAYRASYQTSRFALTIPKSGWDTMRMYEILAAGCVPIFAGLHYSPLGGAMAFLPRELLEMARQLPGVVLNESAAMKGFTSITGYEEPLPALEVDASQFDDAAFRDVAHRLLAFTKRHLTTAAMAAHMLDTCTAHGWSISRIGGKPWRSLPGAKIRRKEENINRRHDRYEYYDVGPVRVLLLGSASEEDYVRDMLLHGLRSWPSLQVTDARRPNHMYFGGSSMRGGMSSSSSSNDRSKLYGHGFSYAEWLPPPMPTWRLKEDGSGGDATNQVREDEELRSSDMPSSFPRSKNQLPWQRMEPLRAAISRRAFDLVVYGSVHRGLPFLTEVTAAYTKEEIVFVDGEDKHGWQSGWCSSAAEFAIRGHYFMREIPNGCPPHLTVSS